VDGPKKWKKIPLSIDRKRGGEGERSSEGNRRQRKGRKHCFTQLRRESFEVLRLKGFEGGDGNLLTLLEWRGTLWRVLVSEDRKADENEILPCRKVTPGGKGDLGGGK